MAAAEYDMVMEQRVTFRRVLRIASLDLTGYSAVMQIRPEAGSPGAPLFELSTANGRIVIDEGERTITLMVTDEETGAFTWSWGRYDLLLDPPGGEAWKLLRGSVQVDRTVTR